MTRDTTRRGLLTVVAALLVVIGGAYAATGQMGAGRGHASSVRATDGPTADDETTAGETTKDETTEDETTEDETTGDETTEDETTEDETTDDDTTEDKTTAATPKASCSLTSPPGRAADAATADRHPGWSTGKHLGWCVAATHHTATGRPAKPATRPEKHVGKPGWPGTNTLKKAHPGRGHGKRH